MRLLGRGGNKANSEMPEPVHSGVFILRFSNLFSAR